MLQLYRVVGGINYLQESGALTRIIKYGKFLPILIVVAHVFACVVLYNSCTFDEEFEDSAQFGAGVRCPQERTFIEASQYIPKVSVSFFIPRLVELKHKPSFCLVK